MTVAQAQSGPPPTGAPVAWRKRPAWTILDTTFGQGQHFLASCAAWLADSERPTVLHYVGIVGDRDTPNNAKPGLSPTEPTLQAIATRLVEARSRLQQGFARVTFANGCISLTLCRAPLSKALRQLRCNADSVLLSLPAQPSKEPIHSDDGSWDKWSVQSLARLCRRGAQVCITSAPTDPVEGAQFAGMQVFESQGFQWATQLPTDVGLWGRYSPAWPTSRNRTGADMPARLPGRAAVIGAGMAGASVARALAVRGWSVFVYEQHKQPAQGASGLPVGLVVPQVSADDNPRSRLSRMGVELMLQNASDFLSAGTEWEATGVAERKPGQDVRWHAQAAWLKPAALVEAWLDHPRIQFFGQTTVKALVPHGEDWVVQHNQGQESGPVDIVVVANAMGCMPLLLPLEHALSFAPGFVDALRALQPSYGAVSSGLQAKAFAGLPPTPVNGHGSFIPSVPQPDGLHWYAGASFETDWQIAQQPNRQNAQNLQRLRELIPDVADVLADDFANARVATWSNTRCVTHDRLPLVGAVQAKPPFSLFICVGMGARGLSFSALCAEMVVAQLAGEPWPMEQSLAHSLDARRTRRLRSPIKL